ncbi:glutamate synthase (NADPH/NADH) large chain [Bacillus ectoiniformans]|uniref:glutamate synthase large subunit n=1 Tax=Bacillus ectoiniformans TaxID=1494429 RepID=UPI00195B20D2|nr:glutamate synthase large subunit [Bacillus ectoiniformans]MBM7649527.1 glutamate synthase (NADPH/NADH) large chain [Bacillus ectoiniformans]
MTIFGYPTKQGLYDPKNEHDACGIGFIANIKGKPAHSIVKEGIHMLCQLEHRGGQLNGTTGDGAGMMLEICDSFFRKNCEDLSISLPDPFDYAIGMVFLPKDEKESQVIQTAMENIVKEEGQIFLGWRQVPVNSQTVGAEAQAIEPNIMQLFIEKDHQLETEKDFERKLFIIRKRIEHEVSANASIQGSFYIPSLSTRTIIYKGMLTPEQMDQYYLDLSDPEYVSAFSLVHSRFSTNTFPSWERAHPYRYLIHNGEINTNRGNVSWMQAREKASFAKVFGDDYQKLLPVIDTNGSDSAMLDNALEFLTLSGRSLPHAAMMLIPEPWDRDEQMQDPKLAFYEYHSCLMEPWDGPTSISFTDGRVIGTILDRNGLRPARYYVTEDDLIIYSSEVGIVPTEEKKIIKKESVSAGKMLLVDLEQGRIVSDDEVKHSISRELPYRDWLNDQLLAIADLEEIDHSDGPYDENKLLNLQKSFGYTYEELTKNIKPMVTDKKDPIGSMGFDSPLAVLSERPQLLFNYFKQLFAQVTNPPIDATREENVTSTMTLLGNEGNILEPSASNCRRIRLESPFLTEMELMKLRHNRYDDFRSRTTSILFKTESPNLEQALEQLFKEADEAIAEGCTLLILSDKGVNSNFAAVPSLLAISGLHQHLIKNGTRTKVSLIAETAEARDVHQFACLIGYGADAIQPYLAIHSIEALIKEGVITGFTLEEAEKNYLAAAVTGLVKVMSKMGISTVQSYRGAQIFEAVGIGHELIENYFTGTASPLDGISLEVITNETLLRHKEAFHKSEYQQKTLDSGGEFQWRRNGEKHAFNPETIHTLQHAARTNNYELYKKYSAMMDDEQVLFLRGLLDFDFTVRPAVPLEEVESAESILKRFKTGAMSYGSISKEAHEALAVAMNRIGGKSNSGEGGEDPSRYTPDENGDSKISSIKQVASGRFGVTSEYLNQASEIQIKMAQGAKPGEGGHLPGKKVYPWIANTRGSTPGVGLISPPPHHDIYSIEDLAQLIYDLKNANTKARINVKLVAKSGVGTIAAGVAKGLADVILVSGYEGGTGASPKTSIKHAGLPWEIGLAETHQTLLMNNLREKVTLETDGKLMNGRDVVIAALLGAEEFGFATAPLVILGCVMMRVCHMDTCPVGVATQNPELRKKFMGSADHIVNYMKFVAEEIREIMAALGFRTFNELIGQKQMLTTHPRKETHWKAKYLDLFPLLYMTPLKEGQVQYFTQAQDYKLERTLDQQVLLQAAQPAIENKQPVTGEFPIRNVDRSVGTITGSEITKKYGAAGLPTDTIQFTFNGSAGQSLGAFIPKGMTLTVNGDANDYFGKGLSGGKLIIRPHQDFKHPAELHSIVGNVSLYGATSGEAYINGQGGARFAVRNSGANVVVEGVGDNGCEYMTGGKVVVLGNVGRNFAAGMSGGIAYIYTDNLKSLEANCNKEMILIETIQNDAEMSELKAMIETHHQLTNSPKAKRILDNWNEEKQQFIRIIPSEFKEMMASIQQYESQGFALEEAKLAAFTASKQTVAVNQAPKLEAVQN